ncbi:peptide/nickel transport system permease protein [Saccharothrix tamanrassetensis]|uniref:Peptide/nickel transport system permease protein n=1 Tax=Saccharothrix tamanrassetensis TaxID=1051531 RepID=A0A841CI37_9PSEU|nr:ABC transporter permease [Saccharothrix tamanrassetensis]MBB5956969.1 peptide/nickel transport system permease protein [Saccharothrix tamanrassetensis]
MRVGLVLTGLVLLVVVIGPFLAPHAHSDIIGAPFSPPSATALLGTDYLGEDVLSRVLAGGRSIVWISFVGTLVGVAVGAAIGMTAAYSGGVVDELLMRTMDVLRAFPPLVLILLLVSVARAESALMPLIVAIAWVPQVARVAYGAAKEVVGREFVESAEALGTPRMRIVRREILPNVMTPLMVDFGLRLTWSIGIVSAMSFLGVGLQPPAADWGLMIKENYQGLALQPWGVVVPVLCVAVFTFGTNLMTEGFARTVARVSPLEVTT